MIRQYTDDSSGWNSGYNNRNYGGDNGTENRGSGYYGMPAPDPAKSLSMHAFLLGIAALVSSLLMTVFLPLILGPVSIVFGVLSRGKGKKLSDIARRGIRLSIIAIAADIVIVGVSFYSVFHDPEVHAAMNQMTESMYGYTLDDVLKQIDEQYGTNLEDLGKSTEESTTDGGTQNGQII
jgi:hypothetical protein